MKKRKFIRMKLSSEVVNILRHKGGPQSTKKGKRGYDRNVEKQKLIKEGIS